MNFISLIVALLFINTSGNSVISDLTTKASTEKKNIAIYFSGSDWCTNCHKFKSQTLQLTEVDELLNNKYVYYTADFPQRKKLDAITTEANNFLADKLNPGGEFPVLVITDENWNILAKIYKGNEISSVIGKLNNNIRQAQ